MRSQFNIPYFKKRTRRPFLWFSVHIEADLHGRTGGGDRRPQNRTMNCRAGLSPLSIQPPRPFSSFQSTGLDPCFVCSFLFFSSSQSFTLAAEWNVFLKEDWIREWNENSPGWKEPETTSKQRNKIKSPNCSFLSSHLIWQLWNNLVKKLQLKKKERKTLLGKCMCLPLTILPFSGRFGFFLFFFRKILGSQLFSDERRGLGEKKCFRYCSLGKSKN